MSFEIYSFDFMELLMSSYGYNGKFDSAKSFEKTLK